MATSKQPRRPSLTAEMLRQKLNESQREAVTYDGGHLLVVAGAGSGKTRVLTYRIAWLLEQGVFPSRVLAITFTNKAAREMRTRIEAMVPEPPSWMGTFHATCARILRIEAKALGRLPDFTIYDRDDSARVVRQVLKDLGLTGDKNFQPTRVLGIIGRAKNEMLGEDQLARLCPIPRVTEAITEIYRRYQARLMANNAMDFDDLLLETVRLFQGNEELLKHYQRKFSHVFVDEYQDTNTPQHLLLRLVAGGGAKVTAVGDPDQMIYGWRGAKIENILNFTREFRDAHVIKLEVNYRSTRGILDAATEVIAQNRFRHPKVLISHRGDGEPVRVFAADSPEDEADQVVALTQQAFQEGRKPADVAIFYRTNFQSRPFEESLAVAGIPYAVLDSIAFFQRKEIKDLRAYMTILLNPFDNEALARVINTPARGIGAKTVEILLAEADKRRVSLMAACREERALAVVPPRTREKIKAFCDLVDQLKPKTGGPIAELLDDIVASTGYLKKLEGEDRETSEEIIGHFKQAATQFDQKGAASENRLREFLEYLALVSDSDRFDPDKNAVSLMTFHAAKGLEFPVVFITGVEKGVLPHHRSVKGEDGVLDGMKVEEERRLFHVGMTRAEERLYISWCRQRWLGGNALSEGPSCFLDELPKEGVEVIGDGLSYYGSSWRPEPRERPRSRSAFRDYDEDEEDDTEDDAARDEGRRGAQFSPFPVVDAVPKPRPSGRRDADATARGSGRRDADRTANGGRRDACATSAEDGSLEVGDEVEHPDMGRGVVVGLGAYGAMQTVDVKFEEGGRKKLILKHSGLMKIG